MNSWVTRIVYNLLLSFFNTDDRQIKIWIILQGNDLIQIYRFHRISIQKFSYNIKKKSLYILNMKSYLQPET